MNAFLLESGTRVPLDGPVGYRGPHMYCVGTKNIRNLCARISESEEETSVLRALAEGHELGLAIPIKIVPIETSNGKSSVAAISIHVVISKIDGPRCLLPASRTLRLEDLARVAQIAAWRMRTDTIESLKDLGKSIVTIPIREDGGRIVRYEVVDLLYKWKVSRDRKTWTVDQLKDWLADSFALRPSEASALVRDVNVASVR